MGLAHGMNLCFPWVLRPVLGQAHVPLRGASLPWREFLSSRQEAGSKRKTVQAESAQLKGLTSPSGVSSVSRGWCCHVAGSWRTVPEDYHTHQGLGGGLPESLWMAGLGPALATPGAGTLHIPDSCAQLEGGVLAGGQALVPTLYVLRGLSCYMPVPVPGVELQMGCEGVTCPGYWWLLFWRRPGLAMGALFGDGGLCWPGAFPDFLPHACRFTCLHACDPAMSTPEFPSPLVRMLPIPLSHLRLRLL